MKWKFDFEFEQLKKKVEKKIQQEKNYNIKKTKTQYDSGGF